MKLFAMLGVIISLGMCCVRAFGDATTQPVSPLDFVVKDIDGHDVNLSDYRGKVVMIVNVASKCGYTPQYDALEKLYLADKDRGLVIIGFPANNFKSQEPGTDEEIKKFCSSKYNVTFPLMSKISVKGDDMAPLYQFLTSADKDGKFGGDIAWNFTKFVVDRNGQVVARFASKVKPTDAELVAAVEQALGK
jgi:glutathione peroxidase